MGWYFVGRYWRALLRLLRLLLLALLEQSELASQGQQVLLLECQRGLQRLQRVFLECRLTLQIFQLFLQFFFLHPESWAVRRFKSRREANILRGIAQSSGTLMAKSDRTNSRLVYSTDGGRLCPQCQRPEAACVCGKARPAAVGDGTVRLHRETKGRGGKAVTIVRGLPLAGAELKALATALKQKCGVGGSVKGDDIEIQGDQRQALQPELERRGYRVKVAGG